MEKRKLGSTNLYISELGYGCAGLWGKSKFVNDDEAEALFRSAYERGINFFDTGHSYGVAEKRLGRCIHNLGKSVRHDLIISTKCGTRYDLKKGYYHDWSVDWMKKSVGLSLKRLHTDYIDLLQVHGPKVFEISDKMLVWLDGLKKDGVVRATGINTFDTDVIEYVCEQKLFDAVMLDYNIMRQDREGTINRLYENGLGVVAGAPLAQRAEVEIADLFKVDDPYVYFGKPDVLLHMAWRDGFIHSSVNHINDLPSHNHFLSTMLDSGLQKIAVMGSMHEVGFFEGSINESTPCNPQSLYGISKNALRRLVELKCKDKGSRFQWLRGFYIVGNTEDGCSIFSKIVQANNKGEQDFSFTMGLNQFDFLDYDVFCKYVADTVAQNDVNGIINICSGRLEKLADRVERFITENRLNIRLNYGAFPDRPYDSKAIWGDDFKIRMIEKVMEEKQ